MRRRDHPKSRAWWTRALLCFAGPLKSLKVPSSNIHPVSPAGNVGINLPGCLSHWCLNQRYRKSEASMDYCVHRLRFADWKPAPIKTLAGDPFSCRLAVGREDGDIEIRDSRRWYNQVTIPGQTNFNLQSLTWAAEKSESGRLFGISLRGFIFEVTKITLISFFERIVVFLLPRES